MKSPGRILNLLEGLNFFHVVLQDFWLRWLMISILSGNIVDFNIIFASSQKIDSVMCQLKIAYQITGSYFLICAPMGRYPV